MKIPLFHTKASWSRFLRVLGMMALDAALVAFAFLLAYQTRLLNGLTEPDNIQYLRQYLQLVGWVGALHVCLFYLASLYRGIARYVGLRDLILIAAAASLAALLLLLYNPIRQHQQALLRVPYWVIALTWLYSIILVGGARVVRRVWAEPSFWRRLARRHFTRGVLIIGAGRRGELVAREIRTRDFSDRVPVGFLDDDPELHGRLIHGIEILGGLKDLDRAIRETGAKEVIVALRSPSPRQMKEIAKQCEGFHVAIERLPSAEDMLEGRVELEAIRPVKIEDLLGREPVHLQFAPGENYLKGERVLVTGAGGSIGSELCRQILPFEPEVVLLLGRGENSLHEAALDLRAKFGECRIEVVLADVQDERKMGQVFCRHLPTIVFHAAAHKHVPFGELAPEEIVRNNVFGALNVARAATDVGVKRFIQISTDKAVRPTNMMGASKRLAEVALATLGAGSRTQFMAVRFGNVLGSRGSVIPLFLRQIESGEAITLTHPDMTRFFMTIPEAASLVLQAGAIGKNGQLFVLDMGEAVKIIDLARNLITLSGYQPEVDIPIRIIGPRPGEKIHEELLTDEEGLEKTQFGKIFRTELERMDPATLEKELESLLREVEDGNSDRVRAALARLVREYQPPRPPDHA